MSWTLLIKPGKSKPNNRVNIMQSEQVLLRFQICFFGAVDTWILFGKRNRGWRSEVQIIDVGTGPFGTVPIFNEMNWENVLASRPSSVSAAFGSVPDPC